MEITVIVLKLLSGVALFLFGMSLMGDGLKKVAGNRLEMILYKLSSTPVKGVLLGAIVTAVIQSSSATSVMVVGFVNSGMMKVAQAIGVIMGANIGTSITGWVLCLSYIEGDSGVAQLLSTATISAVIAIIGICIRMIAKKNTYRSIGDIMMGFAILMVGMTTMSGAVAPLKENPSFTKMFTMFSNPFIGILIGIAFTAVLQSASASVGILQALAVTGSISFATAFPITMGIGVGAACPVLLSGIGSNKNGKRTALVYLLNDLFGMIFWSCAFYAVNGVVHFSFMNMTMSPVYVALLNTVFRVATVFILFPFIPLIEKLVFFLVKESDVEKEDLADFELLEERFLTNAELAISQSHQALNGMAKKARKNILRSFKLLSNFTTERYDKIQEKEEVVDKYVGKLDKYLVQISQHRLTKEQSKQVAKLLNSITDFERIGDGAVDYSNIALELKENKVGFTESGDREMAALKGAIREMIDLTVEAFVEDDTTKVVRIEALWALVGEMCDELKSRHIARLSVGKCKLESGFPFNNLLAISENIGSHCSNVGMAILEMESSSAEIKEFNRSIRENRNEEYQVFYDSYAKRFDIDTFAAEKGKKKNK